MRTFRCALGVLLILLCIWFLLPLVKGITHIGMFYPVLLMIPLICVMFRPSLLKGGKRKKMWIRAAACARRFAAGTDREKPPVSSKTGGFLQK